MTGLQYTVRYKLLWRVDLLTDVSTSSSLILYTHPDCAYSAAAKSDLQKLETEFIEIDISKQPEALEELLKLTGGERITPVMVYGDEVTVGYGGVG